MCSSDLKDGRKFVEKLLRSHGIEVVISVMGGANILDQFGLIKAIKAAGTVKVRPYVQIVYICEHCFVF